MESHRRTRTGAAVTALALICLGMVFSAPAQAAEPAPSTVGQVYGHVSDASTHRALTRVKVALFDGDWKYLTSKTVDARGAYVFDGLDVGTGGKSYWIQVTDLRPTYDVSSHVSRDTKVRLTPSRPSHNASVSLRQGAYVTGRVLVRKSSGSSQVKSASSAKVTVVSDHGKTFTSTANAKGQFAVGGLPSDSYTVFSYDPGKTWTAKGTRVTKLKLGKSQDVRVRLMTRGGGYRGFLTAGGTLVTQTVYVTAVNRSTGQFWVQKVTKGDLSSLTGLAPGSYRIQVPGVGAYVGRTASAPTIHSGSRRTLDVNLSTKGGDFTGTVLDATTSSPTGSSIDVMLFNKLGQLQARTTTAGDGTFQIGGSLAAQTGVTIVVEGTTAPGPVKYAHLELPGLTIKNGVRTLLGPISLDRATP